MVGQYIQGYILVLWELLVNTKAHLNMAIILTFHGKFNDAKQIVDPNWLMLYVAVYVFSIWDSYRTTVELNKHIVLAEAEDVAVVPSAISSLGITYCDKLHPWMAVFWSIVAPGSGNLYSGNIISATIASVCWLALAHLSHLAIAIQYTCTGEFAKIREVVDPHWLLFMPSAFVFIIYSTYVSVIEYNSFFDAEQARYLKRKYQHLKFSLPLKELSAKEDK